MGVSVFLRLPALLKESLEDESLLVLVPKNAIQSLGYEYIKRAFEAHIVFC